MANKELILYQRGILERDLIPFPKCSTVCGLVMDFGVGECESFCGWKFDENGNYISEETLKKRLFKKE